MSLDSSSYYLRDAQATVLTTVGRFMVVTPGGSVRTFDVSDLERASWIWQVLSSPISGEELARLVDARSEDLKYLLEALLGEGIVSRGSLAELQSRGPLGERASASRKRCRRLVLGVTGAVQSLFVASYVRRLLGEFTEELDLILTESAQRLVTPRALTALGARVWCDAWESRGDVEVPHIHLATSTDLVLILPASAHALYRIAHAACSDLLSLVTCATEAPIVVVPGMNPSMWNHPAVRRNVQQLRADGVFVVEPGLGFEVAELEHATARVGGVGLGASSPNLFLTLEAALRLGTRSDGRSVREVKHLTREESGFST